ncbi:MAG: hypothetical protein AAFZ17_16745 [Cyanobacteria bacterium J06650_10]
MASAIKLSARETKKLLTKGIKGVLTSKGISASTRSGNKELDILVKQVVNAPFESKESVKIAGAAIGEKIAELSQKNNKKDLDAGTIRMLRLKADWIAEFDIPVAEKVEKSASKAAKSERTVVQLDSIPAEAETPDVTEVPEAVESSDATDAEGVAADTAPEPVAASSEKAEAEREETSEGESEEVPEAVLSEEAASVPEAAEAEVIESVTEEMGAGETAAPADPEAVAIASGAAEENKAEEE